MRLRIHLAPVLLAACLAAACAQTEGAARPGEAEAQIAELTAERDAAREEVERLEALVARLTALCPPPGFSAPHGPLAAEGDKDARIARLTEERDVAFAEQRRLMVENERARLVLTGSFRKPIPPVPHVFGRVTGVDANLNIVMLSVGRDDGVEVGFEFTVYRGTEYVAKIVVTRVEKDWSSGEIRWELRKSVPRVGDKVATRI